MLFRSLVSASLVLLASRVVAETPNLSFKPAGPGLYEFDTGVLKGKLKVDGKYQGLYPLIDVASGTELTHAPGIFSFYHVFSAGRDHGVARDWPTQTKLLPGGGVEVHWPPAEKHPMEITATYRWAAADTLDLETTVKPQRDMPRFELFMSSYLTKAMMFRASVYMKAAGGEGAQPRFVMADRKPDSKHQYVMFPRDQPAQDMILDGRWTGAVDWDVERWLAAPLVIRREASKGFTALIMCPPDDCFAVSSPWNPPSPESTIYRSLYQSLFGRDLKAGQTARARSRFVLGRDISDEQAVQRFEAYFKGEKAR